MKDSERPHPLESRGNVMQLDAAADAKVFTALQQDPYQLPANFADRVLQKLEARPAPLVKEYIWLGLGWTSFLVAAIVSILVVDFKFTWGAFRFLAGYPGLIAIAAVLIVVFQWLDKRLIKTNLTHSQKV